MPSDWFTAHAPTLPTEAEEIWRYSRISELDLGEQVANPLTPHAASASTPSSPDSAAMPVAAAYRSAFAR